MLHCALDFKLRIFIPNLFENLDPYDCSEYRAISEWYRGAKPYIFEISNLISPSVALLAKLVIICNQALDIVIGKICRDSTGIMNKDAILILVK